MQNIKQFEIHNDDSVRVRSSPDVIWRLPNGHVNVAIAHACVPTVNVQNNKCVRKDVSLSHAAAAGHWGFHGIIIIIIAC